MGAPGSMSIFLIDWTDEDIIALANSIIMGGQFVNPKGYNRHFQMVVLCKLFENARKQPVSVNDLWKKLNYSSDNSKGDETCPFPNETSEFSLPEADFGKLMKDREAQSSSKEKLLDSRGDSAIGRVTRHAKRVFIDGSSAATTQPILNTSTDKNDQTLTSTSGSNPRPHNIRKRRRVYKQTKI